MLEIKTFKDAVAFVNMARMMKDDLPDGQWHDLKELVSDFTYSHGHKTSEWPEEVKKEFVEVVRDNYHYWL